MNNCPFCLDTKKLRGEILLQNEHVYMVESIDTILPDAVMIIPYRHVETPFDMNKDEWDATIAMIYEAKKILDTRSPQGFNIGWNIGHCGGQEVSHAHLHIVARFEDEPLAGKGIRYAFKQPENKRPS